jgi:hypothetical protein
MRLEPEYDLFGFFQLRFIRVIWAVFQAGFNRCHDIPDVTQAVDPSFKLSCFLQAE